MAFSWCDGYVFKYSSIRVLAQFDGLQVLAIQHLFGIVFEYFIACAVQTQCLVPGRLAHVSIDGVNGVATDTRGNEAQPLTATADGLIALRRHQPKAGTEH